MVLGAIILPVAVIYGLSQLLLQSPIIGFVVLILAAFVGAFVGGWIHLLRIKRMELTPDGIQFPNYPSKSMNWVDVKRIEIR